MTKFIRIANVLRELQLEAGTSSDQKNFTYLSRLMGDALEECGVEEFEPKIGTDFREAGPTVTDDPIVQLTATAADDFKIASIQAPGYALETGERPEVIIPAKVSIFRFDTERRDQ